MVIIVCPNCKSAKVTINSKELRKFQCENCKDIFNYKDSIICNDWELSCNSKLIEGKND